MPRPRSKVNDGLPKRWRFFNGAYRYRVPPGQEHAWDGKKQFTLGANLADAYEVFAQRLGRIDRCTTIADVLDAFALRVIPRKAPATRASYTGALPRLRRVFGHMRPHELEPHHVYGYVDRRVGPNGKPALTAAHREVEVLSAALSAALEWGDVKAHPFKGKVVLKGDRGLRPRRRYVTDTELAAALALSCRRKHGSVRMVQAYLRLKLLTGMRKTDLLKLRIADGQPDGIHYVPSKTVKTDGRERIVAWTPALRAAWDACKAARPVDIGPMLFCTRKGAGYLNAKGRAPGFSSVWQRFMLRLTETGVEPFTEHDVRAKAASDSKDAEAARRLLGHADVSTTEGAYRRKPEVVRPLR